MPIGQDFLSITILALIGLLIYSKKQNQTLKETLQELKDSIPKGGEDE
jgi:hypothetical protein